MENVSHVEILREMTRESRQRSEREHRERREDGEQEESYRTESRRGCDWNDAKKENWTRAERLRWVAVHISDDSAS